MATGRAMALVLAARAVLWVATPADWLGGQLFTGEAYAFSWFDPLLRSPVDFLATALTLVALVIAGGIGVASLLAYPMDCCSPIESQPWLCQVLMICLCPCPW